MGGEGAGCARPRPQLGGAGEDTGTLRLTLMQGSASPSCQRPQSPGDISQKVGYSRTSLGPVLLSSHVGVQAVNSLSDRWVGPGACASLPSQSVHALARGACSPAHLPGGPSRGCAALVTAAWGAPAVGLHLSWHSRGLPQSARWPLAASPICGSGSSLVSRPLARPFSPLGWCGDPSSRLWAHLP